MWNRKNYPSVVLDADVIRNLSASGMSQTRIARALHISPTKFKERVASRPDISMAIEAGREAHAANKARMSRLIAGDDDDAFFNEEAEILPCQPLDAIILNAIAAGTCDRAAIEKLLNPDRSKLIQIMPALERLLSHGKIQEKAKTTGAILTKYELTENKELSEKAGSGDEPRGILEHGRHAAEDQTCFARI